jgi:hypothetical protein
VYAFAIFPSPSTRSFWVCRAGKSDSHPRPGACSASGSAPVFVLMPLECDAGCVASVSGFVCSRQESFIGLLRRSAASDKHLIYCRGV